MLWNYLLLILFIAVVVIIKNIAVYLAATKKEREVMDIIKQLKRKQKDSPEKKGELGALAHSLRFKNIFLAIKTLCIRYGIIIFALLLCGRWFSDLSGYIWIYIVGIIVFNIIYKRVVR